MYSEMTPSISGPSEQYFSSDVSLFSSYGESLETIRLHYCGVESCSPGHSFGPAVRSHNLVHFILRGKGVYYRGEEIHELKAGDAFLILPGETTRYVADEKDPWHYTWVAFDGANAENLLRSCGLHSGNVVYHSPTPEQGDWFCKQAQNFAEHTASANRMEILGHFYLLFSLLQTEQIPVKNKEAALTSESTAMFLTGQKLYFSQAVEYLKRNYSYPVETEQLALQIGVSRSYLYKTFIRCCGKGVQEYLMELRLEAAKELLRGTSRSITDIAYSCGFADSPSFCRQFKKTYGLTAGAWRKNS